MEKALPPLTIQLINYLTTASYRAPCTLYRYLIKCQYFTNVPSSK
jgi:hypothetical protein